VQGENRDEQARRHSVVDHQHSTRSCHRWWHGRCRPTPEALPRTSCEPSEMDHRSANGRRQRLGGLAILIRRKAEAGADAQRTHGLPGIQSPTHSQLGRLPQPRRSHMLLYRRIHGQPSHQPSVRQKSADALVARDGAESSPRLVVVSSSLNHIPGVAEGSRD
jgi:hypothetical protein